MIPLRDAGTDRFAAVRSLLRDRGYTSAGVLERTGASWISDARDRAAGMTDEPIRDGLDLLVRLLLGERSVAAADADLTLGADALASLEAVGVVRSDAGAGIVVPTVMLYPVEDVLVASDLTCDPVNPEAPFALPDDVVYPACTRNTTGFLITLPRTPCGRFLELCGGTGVAALLAADRAGIAVTADITERSTRFAEWNAKLNGLANVRAVCGDLYEPVAGETFDRIVAHPPYMPALEQGYTFRDGGEDGEQVTRGTLAGLADHLAPGGSFHATCFLTDREEQPVEQRVRGMLGPRHEEFDVLVVTTARSNVAGYYFRLALEGDVPLETAERLSHRLAELGIDGMVLCTMLVTRRTGPGEPVTLRRQQGATLRPEDLDRVLAVAHHAGAELPPDELRPRLSRNAKLRVLHVPADGGWRAEACVLKIEAPFARTLELAPDVAAMLDHCDGSRAVPALFRALVDDGVVPATVSPEEFAATVRQLVRDGFLEHAG